MLACWLAWAWAEPSPSALSVVLRSATDAPIELITQAKQGSEAGLPSLSYSCVPRGDAPVAEHT